MRPTPKFKHCKTCNTQQRRFEEQECPTCLGSAKARETFGLGLLKAATESGLSRRQVASMFGVPTAHLEAIMLGKTGFNPDA